MKQYQRYLHTASMLVTCLLLAPNTVGATATGMDGALEWSAQEGAERIALYTAAFPDSPFLAVKAVAQIRAPIERVAATFGDGQGCPEWRATCVSSEVLGTVSEGERYVYLVLDMPWPLSDRDLVIHSTATIDRAAGTVTVALQPAPDKKPPTDYVRAHSSGEYRLRATGPDTVELTYIAHVDLGGELSPDLINPRVAAATLEDIQRLLALAEG